MNLFTAFNKAIERSGALTILSRPNAQQRAVTQAVAKARAQWLDALLVDETAAWMSTYQQRPDVLRGLTAVLGLAALAKQHDDGHGDSAHVRVIRGALSTVEQCGKAGGSLTTETVQALSIAAKHAREVIEHCSDAAIQAACTHLDTIARGSRRS